VSQTRYSERGASWTVLLYGPVFAVLGALAEQLTGGGVHVIGWVLAGLGLAAITAPWVQARRRFLSVRVTSSALWQGREELAIDRIAEVSDVGAPAGARVLGGGWSTPAKFDELPIRLDDGTVVLAWAKDGAALRDAIRTVKGWPV
jgi:hypothetical protein